MKRSQEVLHDERIQEVDQNMLMQSFFKKVLVQGNWVILGPKMTCPRKSPSALRVFFFFFDLAQ